jgi:hypothetical protein
MPGQMYDWTCSACATEFVERGSGEPRGEDIYENRQQVVYAIGYPTNISPALGLHDGSGAQLQRVLQEHAGLETQQGWLSFDEAYAVYSGTFGMMSGAKLYHWLGVRGVQGPNIWVSNSSPGYGGVWDTISRSQWAQWGGWSCLWVTGETP